MWNRSPCSRTFRQHKCTDRCNISGKNRTPFTVGRWRHHTKGLFTLASSFSNRQNLISSTRKLKTPLKTSRGNVLVSKTSSKLCPSYIILSGLPWKIALDQKPPSSSSAATTSWSISMGFLELFYGFSFLVFTILASTSQFLSSKSLYRERSQDFPGVRTIFKTYPNFLLSCLVTFPHYIC